MSGPGRHLWIYSTAGSVGVHLAIVAAALTLVPRMQPAQAKTEVSVARLAVDVAPPAPAAMLTSVPEIPVTTSVTPIATKATGVQASVAALAPSAVLVGTPIETSAVAVPTAPDSVTPLPPMASQAVAGERAKPISPSGAPATVTPSSAGIVDAQPSIVAVQPSTGLPMAPGPTSAMSVPALVGEAASVQPATGLSVDVASSARAAQLAAASVAPSSASAAVADTIAVSAAPIATNAPQAIGPAAVLATPVAPPASAAAPVISSGTAAILATPQATTMTASATSTEAASPTANVPTIVSTPVAAGTPAQTLPATVPADVPAPTVTGANLAGRAPMKLASIPQIEPPRPEPTLPLGESLRAFVARYQGTPCLATKVSVAENSANVTAFGSEAASSHFASALQAAFPDTVSAQTTVISPDQCAAVSMIGQWQNSPGVGAGIEVAQTMVENGADLKADIAFEGGSWVTVFLVDDDGKVTDLSDHLALVNGKVALTAPVVAVGAGAAASQLLLAVTSAKELETLHSPFGGRASEFLPRLLDELNRSGTRAAIAIAAFKVYGAGMTLK